MRWNILVETPPGSGEFMDAGLPVFDDGFAEDGSDWGDDESNAITDNLLSLSAANGGVSYAAQWNFDTSPRVGLLSTTAAVHPKLVVAPPAKHKHGHGKK